MLTRHLHSLLRVTGLLLAFVFTTLTATAQTGTIRGVVKDAMGQPLVGASVVLEGTRRGTITDANGSFSLRIPPGDYTLIISYIGVETQRKSINVSANATVDESFDMVNSRELNRVVIVGSRSSVNRSSTQTPAPVDVISSRDLISTGQVEPTQMINFVAPSFNSSRQTIADGTDHIDPATLRGLGPDQVLVLVNGRRRYNTAILNVNGTIGRGSVGTDLNVIPASSIERIEVLRDGAASQYGSDAIAGVINIVLKKNNKGTTLYGHLGQYYAGDGQTQQIGLNHGMKLGKQGYLNISGDIRHRNRTNRVGDYTGTVYTTDVALDNQLIKERNFSRANNIRVGNSEVYNYGVALNAGMPVSKNTQFFVSSIFGWRNGNAGGLYRYPKQTTQVIASLYPDGFLPLILSYIVDRSVIAGFEGKFGRGWNWDVSQTSGGNSFQFKVKNSNNASQFAMGKSAQTEFYAGTLSFNQHTSNFNLSRDFGNEIGLKSFNVATGAEVRFDNYKIAAGEEASYKNYDPASGRVGGAQVFPGFQPANAVDEWRNVLGVYADLESDLTENFLADIVGRFEHYSDYGSSFAGKLALRYRFADFFSLRGAVSNGFRAPSMHQRYFSAISTVFVNTTQGLVPLQQGTFRNNSDIAHAFQIPSLKPEKSMNYSVGFTSKPSANWSITVDGYMIDIKDRIVLTGSFTKASSPVVATILNAYPDVTSAIFFTNAISTNTKGIDIVISHNHKIGKGTLTGTLAGNLNETKVGSDIKSSPILAQDANLANGVLFNVEEEGRLERGQPKSKFSISANYRFGKWAFNARSTRFGEVATIFNGTDRTRDEFFKPKIVSDASLSYRLLNFATFTIGANNIGDVYPDKLKNYLNTADGRFLYSRTATQFGFNGGYYYASVVMDLHNIRIEKKTKTVAAVPMQPVVPVMEEKPKVTDSDGDGVPDATDACPTQAGPASLQGCPDRDGDGVADKDDKCPDTPGPAIFNGCPDRDGDGVPDKDDRCPDVAGDRSNGGCPKEVTKEVKEKVDMSAKQIYFKLNSAELKSTSKPALEVLADVLKKDPEMYLVIEGHTDGVGSDASNLKLSNKRAESVRTALIALGADKDRITATGFGEAVPVATNNTVEGRAKNRRVEMKLRY